MKKIKDQWMETLIGKICGSYKNECLHRFETAEMPSQEAVTSIITKIKQILFPGFHAEASLHSSNVKYFVGDILNEAMFSLTAEIKKAFAVSGIKGDLIKKSSLTAKKFLNTLPMIREKLKKDIQAALDGDPAAKSVAEVVISYPCVEVIMIYRIAHELYRLHVPLLPRMMTEYAHSKTGVDIHPGAVIGEYLFIDHGTGVVIGETSKIGNHVKIYQGVTLGALSFPKDKKGNLIKGLKRHPTIEDHVTLYANATILGGKTVIGKNAVIGGNAWIVSSVKPGETVKKQS